MFQKLLCWDIHTNDVINGPTHTVPVSESSYTLHLFLTAVTTAKWKGSRVRSAGKTCQSNRKRKIQARKDLCALLHVSLCCNLTRTFESGRRARICNGEAIRQRASSTTDHESQYISSYCLVKPFGIPRLRALIVAT